MTYLVDENNRAVGSIEIRTEVKKIASITKHKLNFIPKNKNVDMLSSGFSIDENIIEQIDKLGGVDLVEFIYIDPKTNNSLKYIYDFDIIKNGKSYNIFGDINSKFVECRIGEVKI